MLLTSLVTSFDVRSGDTGRGGPLWDESLRTATAQCYSEDLARSPSPSRPMDGPWSSHVTDWCPRTGRCSSRIGGGVQAKPVGLAG